MKHTADLGRHVGSGACIERAPRRRLPHLYLASSGPPAPMPAIKVTSELLVGVLLTGRQRRQ